MSCGSGDKLGKYTPDNLFMSVIYKDMECGVNDEYSRIDID